MKEKYDAFKLALNKRNALKAVPTFRQKNS